MELTNPNEIKPLLARHGFHFSKSLGQNFLIAKWVPEKIAEMSGADKNTSVLEIGPGIGVLTKELALRAAKVTAVELDAALIPLLSETLSDFNNIKVINGDILKLDLKKWESENGNLIPAVCANLPYNITSPVLTALLSSEIFDKITVMIQKEVARRICARPATAEYGSFTVFSNFYAKPEILFDVSPDCFMPRPKVTSSVISLSRRAKPENLEDEQFFFKVVRAAFAQRRKTLINCLNSAFQYSKDALAELLNQSGLDEKVRGETLGIPEFVKLTNNLKAMNDSI